MKINNRVKHVGLRINATKTQFMINLAASDNLLTEDIYIQLGTSYKYLGYELRVGSDNQICVLLDASPQRGRHLDNWVM